ncbi:MAG TPA: 50S ribosomal protein L29 [Planctomycetota bacterium]|nr:50S ribosomal protein L29 [Planctomycetota bacterium]
MKSTEIRAMQEADLNLQVERLRRELFNMRFKGAVEQIQQSHRLREMKRDIARSLTELRRRAAEKAALR